MEKCKRFAGDKAFSMATRATLLLLKKKNQKKNYHNLEKNKKKCSGEISFPTQVPQIYNASNCVVQDNKKSKYEVYIVPLTN